LHIDENRNKAQSIGMKRKRTQSVTYPYSTVEDALIIVFVLDADDITNFLARIRYLRNVGVPHNMPQPGKGKPILLSIDQIMQLSFALCLEEYGVTPKRAAEVGPSMAMAVKWMRIANPHDDIYAVSGHGDEPQIILGLERLQAWIKDEFTERKGDALIVLNASNLMRRVEQTLNEVNERSQNDVS
jgi:hypothetical protein